MTPGELSARIAPPPNPTLQRIGLAAPDLERDRLRARRLGILQFGNPFRLPR